MNRRLAPEPLPDAGASIFEVARDFLTRARRNPADAVREFLGETIWHWDVDKLAPVQRRAVVFLRMLYLVGRGFVSSRAQQQAMALTYTTMLALVPAFAIMVAIFSIRGLEAAQLQLQAFLVNALAANEETERRLVQALNDMLANMQGAGGVAGIAFFVFLFFTIVSLLGTLEKTLNDIWGVQRRRSFMNKFVIYWCVATLGPIFLGAALVQGSNLGAKVDEWATWGHSVSLRWLEDREEAAREEAARATARADTPSADGFGGFGLGSEFAREFEETGAEGAEVGERLARITSGAKTASEYGAALSWFVSLLLTIGTFTLLYAFLPNTRVRLKPALIGAVSAALLWAATKWALALSSSTLVKYDAVYGSMATIPITMFWLYLSWLIVILGAELTFAIQNLKSQRRDELSSETTQAFKELVALRLMTFVAQAYERGEEPPGHEELEELSGAPLSLCQALLFHLCEDGLLREVEREGGERGYVPARPIDRITVSDVLASLRERRGIAFELREGPDLPLVRAQLEKAASAAAALSDRVTLRGLVQALAESAEATAGPAAVREVAARALEAARASRLRRDGAGAGEPASGAQDAPEDAAAATAAGGGDAPAPQADGSQPPAEAASDATAAPAADEEAPALTAEARGDEGGS
ncbi:MAG: YihY family inner membrane protein [Planctomycetota bacterium]|nr:MAG: YihY family inner membrane protein [Planctomycetota bacterium]